MIKIKHSSQIIQEGQYNLPYHWFPKTGLKYFEFYETKRILLNIFNKFLSKEKINFLDLGCGDGRWIYELSCSFLKAIRVIGIDYSLKALRFAKLISPRIDFVKQDAKALGFKDDFFDLITLTEVIEHLDNDSEISVLNEAHRVLKATGLLVITTPSNNIPVNPKHFRHYSINNLRDLLTSNGFEILDIRGQSLPLCNLLKKLRAKTKSFPKVWKIWKYTYKEISPEKSIKIFLTAKPCK